MINWKQFFAVLIPVLLIAAIPFIIFHWGPSKGDDSGGNETDLESVVWGVDSASLTTEELFSCVRDNFGNPQIWGRYLGTKEGVSQGLTKEEAAFLQSNNAGILLINNQFTDATGMENGTEIGNLGIQLASELGVPDGTAIFADIEPDYPVDSDFIRGYYGAMSESPYEAGIYGVFSSNSTLYAAYNNAAADSAGLKENVIIWTAYPQAGISTESEAPAYSPEAPEGSAVLGWQYGLDAEACNIDTNLFKGRMIEYIWK
ncbi:MAG: glycoside hydrolase domain-containing protein [Bacillota bacterium]